MKVLDMFGSGLPVCAVFFPTLPELVKHGSNGLIFRNAVELEEHLARLLGPGQAAADELLRLRMGARTSVDELGGWDDNWMRIAEPLLRELLLAPSQSRKCVLQTSSLMILIFLVIFFLSYFTQRLIE